jgi:hypothetical protein
MKRVSFILILIVCLASLTAKAQLLKEIKEKALGRSKEVIEFKTTEKAAGETSKVMDKVLEPDLEGIKGGRSNVSAYESMRSEYEFNQHLQIKTFFDGKEKISDFLFPSDADFLGVSDAGDSEKFTIYDSGFSYIFVNEGKKKSVKATEWITNSKDEEGFSFRSTLNITRLEPMTLLNYQCDGYQLEIEDRILRYYATTETDAKLPLTFFESVNFKLPSAMLNHFITEAKGLILYMEVLSKKDTKKHLFQMECSDFNKIAFSIDTTEYNAK